MRCPITHICLLAVRDFSASSSLKNVGGKRPQLGSRWSSGSSHKREFGPNEVTPGADVSVSLET